MEKTIDNKGIIAVLILNFTALKMMFLPSLFDTSLGKSGFLYAFIMFCLEVLVVGALIYLGKKSDKNFFELTEDIFGKVIAKIIIFILLIYFLVNTFSVIQSLYTFLGENIYAKLNWEKYILPIFLMICFVSGSSLKGIVRLVQCFVPLIIIAFVISLFLGAVYCDFSNILPVFDGGISAFKVFDYSYWFGDGLILILFFGKYDKTKSSKPIITTAIVVSLAITFFFLVFYCLYETDSINNKEAIVDMLKVMPQNSDAGNINWLITILWQGVLMLYICLYGFVCRVFVEKLFCFNNAKISIPIVLAVVLTVLLLLNFDMRKVILLLTMYGKYLAIFAQYVLPGLILVFSLRLRRKNEKVVQK